MKMKLFFLVVLIFNIFNVYFAQDNIEIMSFPGPNGIFVNVGFEIPFNVNSKNAATIYKIKRFNPDEKKWADVAELSAPETFESFVKKIHELNRKLKDSIPSNELPLELIWKKARQYKRLDSMKYLGNPLIIRLALGVCYLDKQVEKNKKYVYQISKLDKEGKVLESFLTNETSFPGKYRNNPLIFFLKKLPINLLELFGKQKPLIIQQELKFLEERILKKVLLKLNPLKFLTLTTIIFLFK